MDELNANGKTQLFTNLVWRSNAHTAVRKTSSETEKEKNIIKKYFKKTKKEKTTKQTTTTTRNKQKNGELELSRTNRLTSY